MISRVRERIVDEMFFIMTMRNKAKAVTNSDVIGPRTDPIPTRFRQLFLKTRKDRRPTQNFWVWTEPSNLRILEERFVVCENIFPPEKVKSF